MRWISLSSLPPTTTENVIITGKPWLPSNSSPFFLLKWHVMVGQWPEDKGCDDGRILVDTQAWNTKET